MPELIPNWWVWLRGLMITTEGPSSGCGRLTIRATFMAHAIETSALTIASSYLIKQDWDAYSPEQHCKGLSW